MLIDRPVYKHEIWRCMRALPAWTAHYGSLLQGLAQYTLLGRFERMNGRTAIDATGCAIGDEGAVGLASITGYAGVLLDFVDRVVVIIKECDKVDIKLLQPRSSKVICGTQTVMFASRKGIRVIEEPT